MSLDTDPRFRGRYVTIADEVPFAEHQDHPFVVFIDASDAAVPPEMRLALRYKTLDYYLTREDQGGNVAFYEVIGGDTGSAVALVRGGVETLRHFGGDIPFTFLPWPIYMEAEKNEPRNKNDPWDTLEKRAQSWAAKRRSLRNSP